MKKMQHNLWLRGVKGVNALLQTLPFALCWFLYYKDITSAPYYAKGNVLIVAIFLLLYVIFGRIYEAFNVSLYRISEMVYSQGLSVLISDGILYLVTWLLTKHLPNPLPLLAAFAAQLLLAALWSLLAHRWYFATFPPKRTAVLYDQRVGMEQLISEYGMENKFHVVATENVLDALDEDLSLLDDVEAVFLCGIHSHERNMVIKRCVTIGVRAYVIPRVGDLVMSGAKKMHLFHLPILRVQRYEPNPEYLFLKRAFDMIASGLALIVLSPVMLVTAIAIKATDGGPVLYRQCRLTKDGRCFDVLKFRSMRVDAEKDGVARLSSGEHDDRITPVGRLIRKIRVDELPQLINIFVGDMTIVGPRPERPEIAAQYEAELPEFHLRLQAKAGLTGYAQVYGKYNTTPYDKLQMDLMYIANPSIMEDLRIMFATVKILFVPESTEGVAAGQTTAMDGGNGANSAKNERFTSVK